MERIQLSAPARNLDELKSIIQAGADSIYIDYNFEKEDIIKGLNFAHDNNKKLFVIVNTVTHNEDFEGFDEYLKNLEIVGVDALIASDPGVISIIKQTVSNIDIHLNYQANITNYETANFWYNQGIKSINLSSELSLDEISEIKKKVPSDLSLEVFVHGNISISHSGRYLLTNYINKKGDNKVHYQPSINHKYYLNEEKRPNEYYPIYEDKGGTYIFNSKELCTIEHIKSIIESGINVFKIEGRLKSLEYITNIVKIYKMAIDEYYENECNYKVNPSWMEELKKYMNEDSTLGFYIEENEESID